MAKLLTVCRLNGCAPSGRAWSGTGRPSRMAARAYALYSTRVAPHQSLRRANTCLSLEAEPHTLRSTEDWYHLQAVRYRGHPEGEILHAMVMRLRVTRLYPDPSIPDKRESEGGRERVRESESASARDRDRLRILARQRMFSVER